jgi:hypothetical protein
VLALFLLPTYAILIRVITINPPIKKGIKTIDNPTYLKDNRISKPIDYFKKRSPYDFNNS